MKKYIVLLLVLLALATLASAAEKKDELRYEVNVTIRFNSLNVTELAEVQKVLDGLAAKSCKTKIELDKLPKEDGLYLYNGSGVTYTTPTQGFIYDTGTNALQLRETKEDNE